MSKKKRQVITILILVLVLAASGVGYAVLSKQQTKREKQEAEKEQEAEEITLYSMKEEEITQIYFKNSSQEMTLKKDGERWKDSTDADFPVNQEYVQEMAEEAGTLTASQLVVKDPENLSEYTLDKPLYTIELTNQSGEKKRLVIGEESVAAGGCYAYVDQAGPVYVIASNLTDYFDYTRNEMMEIPDSPAITAEYVTGFELKPAKGKAFAAKYSETEAEFSDVEGWDITKPYQKAVPGSKEALQTLFAGLTDLEPTEGVAYRSTPKLLQQYGLAEPQYVLDVDYDTVEGEESTDGSQEESEASQTRTPHHYRISIGSQNDKEDHYFVSIDGSDGIYLMPVETIDALVDLDAFAYVYRQLHKPVMETLQEIRFTNNQGQEHQIKVSKKEVENGISEDGSTVYDYTILLDGKTELDEYSFQDVYASVFNGLIYSRERADATKGQDQKAQASMTIVTDKREYNLKFLPYDGNNFYRVEQDGICNFLVDINVVEQAMDQILSAETVEEAKAKETEPPTKE